MERLKQEKEIENKENFSTKIELHFFRHDDKKSPEGKADQEIQISEEGRKHAASFTEDDSIKQSVAFGSPRVRTKETAALHMAGRRFTEEELEKSYTLDKLIEKIGPNKIATDERLDFILGINEKFTEEVQKSFDQGTFLKFLVEESDDLAKEIKDENVSSYSRVAARIAEIVNKYLIIASRFEELVKEHADKYSRIMKRFMGTHQTTSECFLAKVIEKTDGIEARNNFVKALNNQGFNSSEGFECDIVTDKEGKTTLHIKFEKPKTEEKEGFVFNRDINPAVIDEIVNDFKNKKHNP